MNNSAHPPDDPQAELSRLLEATRDRGRPEAVAARHAKGYRTARENLEDLCDPGSFVEYGQLAVAAQRQRRSLEDLRGSTPADGVITGLATINADCQPLLFCPLDEILVALRVGDHGNPFFCLLAPLRFVILPRVRWNCADCLSGILHRHLASLDLLKDFGRGGLHLHCLVDVGSVRVEQLGCFGLCAG